VADWYSTFGDGTYQTSTGNIGFGNIIFYDRKFLTRAQETVVLYPFGQRRPLPKGNGKQVRYFRYNEIPVASAFSALTEGINPDATKISGQEINATIVEYGAFSQHSSIVSDTHIDRDLEGVVGLWGDHAGRTIDLKTWNEVALYGMMPMRVDEYQSNSAASLALYNVAVQHETTSNTSTSVMCASATVGTTADWWNCADAKGGGLICITAGTNEGQTRYVTDYASAGTWGTITVSPGFEAACDSSSKFALVGTSALTTADIPTYNVLREVKAKLTKNLAPKFSDGYYVAIMDPDIMADLMSDSRFTTMTNYKPEGGYYKGEVGRMHGFRFIEATQNWKSNTNTTQTYSATGRVYTSLFLGQQAFGVTSFPGQNKAKIIIKNPGPQDTSNPLNRYSTVGWTFAFVPKALNSKWCIGLWSYH